MVPDSAAPALGERCAVCHGDISLPHQANCSHDTCLSLGGAHGVTMVDGTSQGNAGGGAAEEASPELAVTVPATEMEGITVEAVPVAADALVSVLSYLPCRADRVHMSSVNRHWRNSLKPRAIQLPPQLPWLLLPSSTKPLFHDTMGGATHVLPLPPDVKAHARFCGSSEGGWFVLAMDKPWPNLLYNIDNGDRFELPQRISSSEGTDDMTLQAAALSAPPSPYIIAAIVTVWGQSFMAYWAPSKKFWVLVDSEPDEDGVYHLLEDVVYHAGAFWFISDNENIQILSPQVGPSGMIEMRVSNAQVKQRRDLDMMSEDRDEAGFIKRYLVKSRNEILMVTKYAYRQKPTIRNWLVRVFKFRLDAEEHASWQNLMFQLPGRLLFVGCGCSRSFEAQHFPGFQEHPKVYFLDDHGVEEDSEEEESDGFLRDDNGRFSLLNLGNELWPPAGQIPPWSDRFPPIWWLH